MPRERAHEREEMLAKAQATRARKAAQRAAARLARDEGTSRGGEMPKNDEATLPKDSAHSAEKVDGESPNA